MKLTEEQLDKFIGIYSKTYNKEIDREEARDQAMKLIQLLIRIYKPMPLEKFEAIQKRRLEQLPDILRYISEHDQE